MITVKIEGMEALKARLSGMSKQIPFAASKALNNVAFAVNAEIKEDMKRIFKGGATPFTLRSFRINKADKRTLQSVVRLRDDANYSRVLSHLFSGGTREWKAVEGWLRQRGLLPANLMAVPGNAIPLDSRGNIRKTTLGEMLGVLGSNIRNLRVDYTRGLHHKKSKVIGFFVVLPGSTAARHLQPGIWRRVEQGDYRSAVQPYVMYVPRGRWRRFIDLASIAQRIVDRKWQAEFDKELADAIRSAL